MSTTYNVTLPRNPFALLAALLQSRAELEAMAEEEGTAVLDGAGAVVAEFADTPPAQRYTALYNAVGLVSVSAMLAAAFVAGGLTAVLIQRALRRAPTARKTAAEFARRRRRATVTCRGSAWTGTLHLTRNLIELRPEGDDPECCIAFPADAVRRVSIRGTEPDEKRAAITLFVDDEALVVTRRWQQYRLRLSDMSALEVIKHFGAKQLRCELEINDASGQKTYTGQIKYIPLTAQLFFVPDKNDDTLIAFNAADVISVDLLFEADGVPFVTVSVSDQNANIIHPMRGSSLLPDFALRIVDLRDLLKSNRRETPETGEPSETEQAPEASPSAD